MGHQRVTMGHQRVIRGRQGSERTRWSGGRDGRLSEPLQAVLGI